ncbi:hypothetical protein [Uliginosibacterium sediminicola]|uniref:Uncharacterized protein n=1 Tax=Uliginosibacterium sediminicola TaxID=2024550 RepID=A0ABU9YVU1_9RHOO
MDFSNAQLPAMTPLAGSFEADDVEAELKQLTRDLFAAYLASDTFDVSVAGVAHLGSDDLVGRAITADGLAFPMDGATAGYASRYLYKAWRGQNGQGRGLHFLRTYIQMLFPNSGAVYQLWQKKGVAYPTDLSYVESDDRWLTSRLDIYIDATDSGIETVKKVTRALQAVLPARFVPTIRAVTLSGAQQYFGATLSVSRIVRFNGEIL